MKINVALPSNGTQKTWEIDDEKKLNHLNDKKLGQEFDAGLLSEEFKGYIFKITGGQDKTGFPMKQGVLANSRVKLLLPVGSIGFKHWRGRKGERKRRTIRGCIIASDIAMLNCVITQKGGAEIAGVTDVQQPRRLGPKRASKIRRLFDLGKDDDVRKFVFKRTVQRKKEGKKPKTKAPKIQRLVTPVQLQRRRRKRSLLKERRQGTSAARKAYQTLLNQRKQLSLQRRRATTQRVRKATAARK